MIFRTTSLAGAYIIDLERLEDERGFFARTFCSREFEKRGLNPRLVQCNVSTNRRRGTWRGMHYQVPPRQEAKLVRCTRGAICDVMIDLRPDSCTYGGNVMVNLDAQVRRMVYIPEGFAHGFITLEDDTEVFYQMSEYYSPECARGFRWNDPAFSLRLPIHVAVVSDRDRDYPDFAPARHADESR